MFSLPPDWKEKYGPIIWKAAQWLAAAILGAVATWLGTQPAQQIVIKEVQVLGPQPDRPDIDHPATGWSPDADATNADTLAAKFRNFASTPAGQVQDIPKQVFLWKAVEQLTGKPAPMKDQNPRGWCVGYGTTTSIERTLASEILARRGDKSEFAFFSEEVTYSGSHVQGARALGARVSGSDGSAGVFVKAWFESGGGMCPEGVYGGLDLTSNYPNTTVDWNRQGPPAEILAVCKKHPVKDAAKVTSWEQCKRALASGYAISGCARWSYSKTRDANGVAAPTREGWNHCMAIDGYIVIDNGQEYGHVENSWSNIPDRSGARHGPYHTGPVGWGNPTGAGFWASSSSLDAALRQNDSFAFSGITGFPAKKLPDDWFIAAPRQPRNALAALKPEWSLTP